MHLSINLKATVALLVSVASIALGGHDRCNDNAETLDEWYTTAVIGKPGCPGLFPNQTGWETSFERSFAKNATMSFGLTPLDFDGLFTVYQGAETSIEAAYTTYILEFTSLVTVPNPNDLGGVVFVTGLEIGTLRNNSQVQKVTDGGFAIVSEINGQRIMTEWREASNFKF